MGCPLSTQVPVNKYKFLFHTIFSCFIPSVSNNITFIVFCIGIGTDRIFLVDNVNLWYQ